MSELYHYGTLGMKWHQRRYSNEQGQLNSRGRSRYKTGNEFRKAGARFEAPGEKLGNLTTTYKRKHKSRSSEPSVKKMGGRTAFETTVSKYKDLSTDSPAYAAAMEYGQLLCGRL